MYNYTSQISRRLTMMIYKKQYVAVALSCLFSIVIVYITLMFWFAFVFGGPESARLPMLLIDLVVIVPTELITIRRAIKNVRKTQIALHDYNKDYKDSYKLDVNRKVPLELHQDIGLFIPSSIVVEFFNYSKPKIDIFRCAITGRHRHIFNGHNRYAFDGYYCIFDKSGIDIQQFRSNVKQYKYEHKAFLKKGYENYTYVYDIEDKEPDEMLYRWYQELKVLFPKRDVYVASNKKKVVCAISSSNEFFPRGQRNISQELSVFNQVLSTMSKYLKEIDENLD